MQGHATFGYELLDELGRGGMGRVFRARHRATGELRALKVLDGSADAEALARFEREIDALARLGQDGVVPILEAGRDPQGRLFYAMEVMPGGSLRERVRKRGRYPWPEAAAIVASLARTLERCHALGLIHRDVKPGNILFDAADAPRLADFGCARDLGADALTRSGTSLGTPSYMAPEQLEGKKVDGRADVFSLGVLLYELATGIRPYSGKTWDELLSSARSESRRAMSELAPVPPELEAIVAKALRVDPERRYARAALLADDLEAVLQGDAISASLGISSSGVARTSGLRALGFALLGAVIALSPASVWFLYRERARALVPAIALDAPGEGATLREGEDLRVAGHATGRFSRLEVNGAPIEARGPSGAFETKLALSPGTPEVVVAAVAENGARVEVRRRVTVERLGLPPWWSRIPQAERAPVPLPRGLAFGERPGEYVNTKDGSVLLFVPAGTFRMGTEHGDRSEAPVHDVELSAYFVGKLEVTNAQFDAFAKATGWTTGAEFLGSDVFDYATGDFVKKHNASWRDPLGDGRAPAPEEPVVHVNWQDALVYTLWAGLALPSEAQWERAAGWDAREGKALRYGWGDDAPGTRKAKLANLADLALRAACPQFPIFDGFDDGFARVAPVGSFPDGASPSGALDMMGNVSEWCEDEFDEEFYTHSPKKDPVCFPTKRADRAGRGPSFCSVPQNVRVTIRYDTPLWWSSDFRGFRVVRAATDAK